MAVTPVAVEREELSRRGGKGRRGWVSLVALAVTLLIAAIGFGGYHLCAWVIEYLSVTFETDALSRDSMGSWLVAAVIVLLAFGVIRFAATAVSKVFKFAFKIAQSDVVTIILAVGVNVLLLAVAAWLTRKTMWMMSLTEIPTFFESGNILAVATLFVLFAGAVIWVPRLGVYGENKLGQFDD